MREKKAWVEGRGWGGQKEFLQGWDVETGTIKVSVIYEKPHMDLFCIISSHVTLHPPTVFDTIQTQHKFCFFIKLMGIAMNYYSKYLQYYIIKK